MWGYTRTVRMNSKQGGWTAAVLRSLPPVEEILNSILHGLGFVHHRHRFVLQCGVSHTVVNVFVLLEHPQLHLRLHAHCLRAYQEGGVSANKFHIHLMVYNDYIPMASMFPTRASVCVLVAPSRGCVNRYKVFLLCPQRHTNHLPVALCVFYLSLLIFMKRSNLWFRIWPV